LSSWKEIAAYVGKGIRTVQRWELEHGFPVRRPALDRRIVMAIPAEIDAWIMSNEALAAPAEIDGSLIENQGLGSNGETDPEQLHEELVNARAEIAELRKRVAELRLRLKHFEQANERRASH
jgi:hypothetical protein